MINSRKLDFVSINIGCLISVSITCLVLCIIWFSTMLVPEINIYNTYDQTNCTIINKFSNKHILCTKYGCKDCYYPTYEASYLNMTGYYVDNSICSDLNSSLNTLNQTYHINQTYVCFNNNNHFVFDKSINQGDLVATITTFVIFIVSGLLSLLLFICLLICILCKKKNSNNIETVSILAEF